MNSNNTSTPKTRRIDEQSMGASKLSENPFPNNTGLAITSGNEINVNVFASTLGAASVKANEQKIDCYKIIQMIDSLLKKSSPDSPNPSMIKIADKLNVMVKAPSKNLSYMSSPQNEIITAMTSLGDGLNTFSFGGVLSKKN